MYYWQFNYIENVRKLYLRKQELEMAERAYPQGTLTVITRKKGNEELYYNLYEGGVHYKKYLSPKRDAELLKVLREKTHVYPGIRNELKQLNCLYKKLLPMARQILSQIKIHPHKYPPSPSENPIHPEWIKYITSRGEKVRSISERIIADTLYKYHIDYKYEKTLNLNGVDLHPDFTIVSPLSGTVYYWEHLGLNTEEYIKSWHKRLAVYAENNINIGVNLIVSVQEDINEIESMVREWFTMERYKGIMG